MAETMIAVGGRGCAEAIIDSLGQPLTRRSLLVRAHVLKRLDRIEIVQERIRLAIEDLEQQTPQSDARRDARDAHTARLREVQSWLSVPDYLDDADNWPGFN